MPGTYLANFAVQVPVCPFASLIWFLIQCAIACLNKHTHTSFQNCAEKCQVSRKVAFAERIALSADASLEKSKQHVIFFYKQFFVQVPPQIFDTGKCEPRITRCQLLCDIPLKSTSISFTCVRVGIVTVNPVPTCTMKTCSNCVSADFRPKLVWWFAESSSLGKFEADLSIVCAIDACGSHAAFVAATLTCTAQQTCLLIYASERSELHTIFAMRPHPKCTDEKL